MVHVDVEYAGGAPLSAKLAAVPRELRPRFRKALKGAAEVLKSQAAANASWSTRIPPSLAIRVSFARRGGAVYVQARRKRAPHARLFEGIEGEQSWRHPVFGNRNAWVRQPTRPFLVPALRRAAPEAVRRSTDAVREAARRSGLDVT